MRSVILVLLITLIAPVALTDESAYTSLDDRISYLIVRFEGLLTPTAHINLKNNTDEVVELTESYHPNITLFDVAGARLATRKIGAGYGGETSLDPRESRRYKIPFIDVADSDVESYKVHF